MASRQSKLDRLIVVGDKVLIRPCVPNLKTKSGLLLPPGYSQKEEIQHGYIVKTGPGIPIPVLPDEDNEPWKRSTSDPVRYIPLQAKIGDKAVFLLKNAIEILYHDEKYFIVPQHALLLLERDENLDGI